MTASVPGLPSSILVIEVAGREWRSAAFNGPSAKRAMPQATIRVAPIVGRSTLVEPVSRNVARRPVESTISLIRASISGKSLNG